MSNEKIYNSNITYYYVGWALLMGFLIYAKHFTKLEMFIVNIALIPIIVTIIVVTRFYGKSRISTYIDIYHKEKWDDIYKRFGIYGRGMGNIPKLFLVSNEYYNDPILKKLKQNYRQYISFSYIVFVSYFIYLILA